MKLKINEIFYSLQGEGRYTGYPAIFIRLSGCNLKCYFCDTKHESGNLYSVSEIMAEIEKKGYKTKHIVFTGGEPSLQLTDDIVAQFKSKGYFIQVETNGTKDLPKNVDFITCSPKFEYCKNAEIKLSRINELKVVYNGNNNMNVYDEIKADSYALQPCDVGNEVKNKDIVKKTIDFILANPKWTLSLQTQKILNVQ